MEKNQLLQSYNTNMELLTSFSFAILTGYYPLCYFIRWFLQEYIDSLVFLEILLPGLVISSCITVILFNYYKVLNKNDIYFKISLLILVVATVLNGSAYRIFNSAEAISCASIVTLVIWYLVAQGYLVKNYNVKWTKNCIYIILISTVYYVSVKISEKELINMLLYVGLYGILTVVFYRKIWRTLIVNICKIKMYKG
jgi:O-antigen/teichoic acid export membrane protein